MRDKWPQLSDPAGVTVKARHGSRRNIDPKPNLPRRSQPPNLARRHMTSPKLNHVNQVLSSDLVPNPVLILRVLQGTLCGYQKKVLTTQPKHDSKLELR